MEPRPDPGLRGTDGAGANGFRRRRLTRGIPPRSAAHVVSVYVDAARPVLCAGGAVVVPAAVGAGPVARTVVAVRRVAHVQNAQLQCLAYRLPARAHGPPGADAGRLTAHGAVLAPQRRGALLIGFPLQHAAQDVELGPGERFRPTAVAP